MGLMEAVSAHPALCAAAGFFVCLEGHYLWRLLGRVVLDRYLLPRKAPLDLIRNYTFCSPTDLDAFLHMNNARYAREMDFGRWGYYVRTGLYKHWAGRDVRILQTAMILRFRKEVSLFMPLALDTQMVYWDDANIYFEQKLVTMHDGRARCVSYSQQRVVGDMSAVQLMAAAFGEERAPPAPSESLRAFIEANASSQRDLALVEKRD